MLHQVVENAQLFATSSVQRVMQGVVLRVGVQGLPRLSGHQLAHPDAETLVGAGCEFAGLLGVHSSISVGQEGTDGLRAEIGSGQRGADWVDGISQR
ncbi:hypothetical protein D3C76_1379130 [compost metagenome]